MLRKPGQTGHLLCAGAIHIDDVASPTAPLAPRASNPVNWQRYMGGVGANAACAAARQTGIPRNILFTGAVGDDPFASQLESTLQALGIKTALCQFKGQTTGRYSAIMDLQGELYIGLSDVSLAEKLSLDHIQRCTSHVDASTVLVDANLSESCLTDLASLYSARSTPLVALSVSPVKSLRLLAIASDIQLLFCNRREAQAMTNQAANPNASLEHLADALGQIGFKDIVLTDGDQPLLVQVNAERNRLPVPPTTGVHNVNGAGDALAGASIAAWNNGLGLVDAVREHGLPEAAGVVQGNQAPLPL